MAGATLRERRVNLYLEYVSYSPAGFTPLLPYLIKRSRMRSHCSNKSKENR
ncbi:MAG: hypothetical protein GDA56_32370 [Hormoscilla sp. GM7CHS1pb]|nr:hypothetical protein [Hormoscilla sp. GM7CHS1pb]